MRRYRQWDGAVGALVLEHEAGWLWQGGPRGPNAQGGMQDPQLRMLKMGVEATRVIENHVETVDSSYRGREELTTDKGNIDSIKRT